MTSIRAEEEMARVLLLATALLFGCGDPASDSPTGPHPAQTSGPSTGDPALRVSTSNMAQWARSCALCHVGGEGGAPRIGDPDEWAERIEQGESALLTHTIEGYNRMPPLGYCMDCESEDFEALIRFMAHGS